MSNGLVSFLVFIMYGAIYMRTYVANRRKSDIVKPSQIVKEVRITFLLNLTVLMISYYAYLILRNLTFVVTSFLLSFFILTIHLFEDIKSHLDFSKTATSTLISGSRLNLSLFLLVYQPVLVFYGIETGNIICLSLMVTTFLYLLR